MANIIDAWKKLGKKLTGKDITGTNLVNVIDDIADNYEGGGSGGGGGFAIHATEQTEETNEMFIDKTYAEIRQYIEDNNDYNIILVVDPEEGNSATRIYTLISVYGTAEEGELVFSYSHAQPGSGGGAQTIAVVLCGIISEAPDRAIFSSVSTSVTPPTV